MSVPFTDGREEERLAEILSSMPHSWACAVCERVFPLTPDGEFPRAVEIITGADGLKREGGGICKRCSPQTEAAPHGETQE